MAKRVIEIPDELSALGDAFESILADVRGTVARTSGGKAVDYEEVETAISADAGRVERAAHQAILQSLDIEAAAVIIGGVRYNCVGRCPAPYHTLAGSVAVERSLYRRSGARGGSPEGKVVDAVSLRAGVVGDGWLPRTARAMAHEVQKGTSREAQASAQQTDRLPYSRASFERVAHLVGALAVANRQDIEDALIDAYEVPKEARSISVSLDRVSVPMEEPRQRPVGRPRKGAPQRPVARNYRMAYCATLTLHDEQGASLHTIRYGCMPAGDIDGLCRRLAADVATLRSKKRGQKIQLLCDGAPELWNRLEAAFPEQQFGTPKEPIHQLVDLHHLMEKLGKAAPIIDPTSPGTTLQRWKLELLNRGTAATRIFEELIASEKENVRVGDIRPVYDAITYLARHAENTERMNYARARRLGLPLASGNVEATCKSLFAMRLKRCGSRWKEETGEHIVQLRALALSDRWDPAVKLVLRPLRLAVRAA